MSVKSYRQVDFWIKLELRKDVALKFCLTRPWSEWRCGDISLVPRTYSNFCPWLAYHWTNFLCMHPKSSRVPCNHLLSIFLRNLIFNKYNHNPLVCLTFSHCIKLNQGGDSIAQKKHSHFSSRHTGFDSCIRLLVKVKIKPKYFNLRTCHSILICRCQRTRRKKVKKSNWIEPSVSSFMWESRASLNLSSLSFLQMQTCRHAIYRFTMNMTRIGAFKPKKDRNILVYILKEIENKREKER